MAGLPSDGCGWLIVERIADIALNSQWKAKGRELRRFVAVRKDLPAHAISIKNKHLLLACATNPRIHGGCFGV